MMMMGLLNFPNLIKLVLTHLDDWDSENLSKLFKSCPILEVLELNIQWCKQRVSCQNLRALTINVGRCNNGYNYIINAPKLEFLVVDGGESSFRFVERSCSLTKAKIKTSKLEDEQDPDYLEKMSALVQGMCSVESLELTSIPLYTLVRSHHIVPTFYNLLELHIHLDRPIAGKNMLRSLHCTPNLEFLYIDKCNVCEKGVKWGVPYPLPLCLSQKIKKIKAMRLEGSKEELEFLKYILSNANALKSVFVGVSSYSAARIPKEARFCKNLFTCPRSSKTCRIDFRGGYLHASSTDNHSCAKAKLKCEIQI